MDKIFHFSSKPLMKRVAKYCLDNNLFIPCWSLESWYRREIHYGHYINHIFIYKRNNKPLGALSIRRQPDPFDSHNSGLIVKTDYRRQGIGTQLVQRCLKDKVELIPWRYGLESRPFYNKVMPL